MTEFQELFNQIPIRQNWISIFLFCGIVQGFLLSSVIAFRNQREQQSVRFFGFLIFFLSLILLDNYLCYTGLMKYVLHFNDSTEVLVLLLGPMIYFFIKSILTKEKIELRTHWMHFIFPVVYFLTQIQYYLAPIEVKINAYLGAYFPELGFVNFDYNWDSFFFLFKDEFREILIFSFLSYIFLIVRLVVQNKAKFTASFWKLQNDKYGFSKNALVLFIAAFLVIFLVFWNFETDLGDHIISLFLSLCIFLISFSILAQSKFFEKSWVADKYDTSGLQANHEEVLAKVQSFLAIHKTYLEEDLSLQDLAAKINIPANYISQAINKGTRYNFTGYINKYRIGEAKMRLVNSKYANLSIAGIGKSVGFKSKSAFYSAFKKQTLMTPKEYLKSVQPK